MSPDRPVGIRVPPLPWQCSSCKGRGYIKTIFPGKREQSTVPCPECRGRGQTAA